MRDTTSPVALPKDDEQLHVMPIGLLKEYYWRVLPERVDAESKLQTSGDDLGRALKEIRRRAIATGDFALLRDLHTMLQELNNTLNSIQVAKAAPGAAAGLWHP